MQWLCLKMHVAARMSHLELPASHVKACFANYVLKGACCFECVVFMENVLTQVLKGAYIC